MSEDKNAEDLPLGWEVCESGDGSIFYYNRALEVSTSERPGRTHVERFVTAKPSTLRGNGTEPSNSNANSDEEESDEDFDDKPSSPKGDLLRRRLILSQARTASTKDVNGKEDVPERGMVGSGSQSMPNSPEMVDKKKQRSKSSLTKLLFKKKDKSDALERGLEDLDWEKDRLNEAEEWIKSEEAANREKKWDAPPKPEEIDAKSLTVLDIGCLTYGFNPEYGKGHKTEESNLALEEKSKHTNYFQTMFSSAEHHNFVGDDDILGPIVVSIQSNTALPPDQKNYNVIVRTKKGDERLVVPRLPTLDSPEACIKYLRNNTNSLQTVRFSRVVEPKAHQDLVNSLLSYEKQLIQKNYKFGVLYVRDGQKEENEYFNNVEYSEGFREFLKVIADEIPLKGFTGFAGGLDCRNSTGLTSFHTTFENIQVMLHVSTLLPYFPKDLQQVERKRHLGNDVVMIIYKEGPSVAFDPRVVASQFNHVFAVVQPEGDKLRVCLANKFGVKPYTPNLPEPCLFEKNSYLKRFLLTKLINGERAAMYAPDFRGTLARTREVLLRSMVEKHNVPEQRSGLRRLSDAFKTQHVLNSGRKKSISSSGNRLTLSEGP
ncbi:GTPase-activating Rap/Ran-GAP domain-like protein 3 [Planoprotostelium fungivorum]|uniref:GTPase-activating Rap/Ran-GAP domain-like protein 3 n=1 Tax=Planoprotostelium fungivorum TaxID=1890364 RepID=A0A2P6NP70_9EUKA|nr:GTPase-activating Rap/Ran-GAP domain-like protein 3 [Planoprotostelium fungivorum]